ncbi:MAG: metallophosphoesterase family protein [Candidatus Tectomicrobia bacterium]|nr:metallophosphoesterase family protein [Candidatus Tectomicrobia bacterium]
MRIGVLSDTHGFFDPQLCTRFAGVAHIVHCGDIGHADVIERLRSLAPVSAVLGNVDLPHLRGAFPEELQLELGGVRCFVRHQGMAPQELTSEFEQQLRKAGVRVFAFGHSHRPLVGEHGGVLFFNPGSAGRKRFHLPRTAGLLHLEGATVRAEIVPLE